MPRPRHCRTAPHAARQRTQPRAGWCTPFDAVGTQTALPCLRALPRQPRRMPPLSSRRLVPLARLARPTPARRWCQPGPSDRLRRLVPLARLASVAATSLHGTAAEPAAQSLSGRRGETARCRAGGRIAQPRRSARPSASRCGSARSLCGSRNSSASAGRLGSHSTGWRIRADRCILRAPAVLRGAEAGVGAADGECFVTDR